MDEQEKIILDLVVNTSGIEEAKTELSAFDKYIEAFKKRAAIMVQVHMTPAARLDDKVASPASRVISMMDEIAEPRTAKLGLDDRVSAPAHKVTSELTDIVTATYEPIVRLSDHATSPAGHISSELEDLDKKTASPTAKLTDKATEPARRVESRLHTLTSHTWSVVVAVKDLATGTLSAIGRRVGSLTRAATSLPSIIIGGAATYEGGVKPLGLANDLEQADIAFETFLGNKDKATAFIGELQDFANKTPFEFPELRDSAKRLLAFKFAADKIIPMETALGNAAAGLGVGKDGIDRISLALGQMKAKAKVSGDEMMQLTEVGIPAWDILAQKMGTSTAAVMQLSEKGLIPADKAIDALIDGMNERFPNMMEKQSKTLGGLWSTIQDTFSTKILTKWGQGLSDALKPRFEKLGDWIDDNDKTIQRWGERLQHAATAGGDWILSEFESTFSYLKSHYFDNPEFQKLDFAGKIHFVVDDLHKEFSKWYDDKGKTAISNVAMDVTKGLADSISDNAQPIADAGIKVGLTLAQGMAEGLQKEIDKHPVLSFVLGGVVGAKMPGPLPVKVVAGGYTSLTTFGNTPLVTSQTESLNDPAYQVQRNKELKERGDYGNLVPLTIGDKLADITGPIVNFVKGLFEQKNQSNQVSHPYSAMLATPFQQPSLYTGAFEKHAKGGILTRPHLGMVAEAGPEAVIPLSTRLRDRSLSIWEQAGEMLGIPRNESGGMVGANSNMITSSDKAITIQISGDTNINISDSSDLDEEALALRIGSIFVSKIKKSMENR